MAKKLKLWNGRGHGKDYNAGSFYVAAYSVKQAAEIISAFSNRYLTSWEINTYYSNCWGTPINGITPNEPCLYGSKRHEKPIRLI